VKANPPDLLDGPGVLISRNQDRPGAARPGAGRAGASPLRTADAETAVTALYQVHAVVLIRLAVVVLGERSAAEDVVQEAFCALYRRWEHLADRDKALAYVRSSILNGCRSELRRRIRSERTLAFEEITGLFGNSSPRLDVRLLDTAAPGSSLLSSRVAGRFSTSNTGDAIITPDGTKIVVSSITHTARAFTAYSTATGNRVAVAGRRPYPHANYGGWPVIYWASPSGGTLIVDDAGRGSKLLTSNGGLVPGVLAVVTGSRFLPIPGSDSQAAW
jgi:hypothetical protein